jgi:membrane protein
MRRIFDTIGNAFRRGHAYVSEDIWQVGQPGEKIPGGFFIKNIRVAILLMRGITEETLLLRASALTFATLLFIVPFMVFMFAFIQTFDLGDKIYLQLSLQLNQRFEQAIELLDFDKDREAEEKAAAIAAAEAALAAQAEAAAAPPAEPEVARFETFWTDAMNPKSAEEPTEVEEVPEPIAAVVPVAQMSEEQRRKALWNALVTLFFPHFEVDGAGKDSAYLDPVDMLVNMAEEGATSLEALGLTGLFYVLITVLGFMRNVEWTFNRIWGVDYSRSLLRTFSDYIAITLLLPFVAAVVLAITAALATLDASYSYRFALRGGQLALVVLTFTLLYKVVPNTKVQLKYALLGGIVAGAAWMLMSWAYVTFQVGLAKNVFFFSTFALFPLLLFWIYTSWVILLYGALLTFAYQNEKTFAMERYSSQASHAYRESVAVRAMVEMTRRFRQGLKPLSIPEMAQQWNVPTRLLHATMQSLSDAGFVTMLASDPPRYQPGRSPENTTITDVVKVVRDSGVEPSMLRREKQYRALYKGLDEGDNHYLDMTIAAMAEKLDTKAQREQQEQPEGKLLNYPRSL